MQNGNLSALKAAAKTATICDGAVTLWMLPYETMLQRVIYNAIDDSTGSELSNYQVIYAIACGVLIDIAIEKGNEDQSVIKFGQWWELHDTADPVSDFHLYSLLVDESLSEEIGEAYNNTRIKLPESAKILQEGKPEAGDPLVASGSKPTKKKS